MHWDQYFDKAMPRRFFRNLGIRQTNLNLGLAFVSHAEITANVLHSGEGVLVQRAPAAAIAGNLGGRTRQIAGSPRLGYADCLRLLLDAGLVLSDTGGVQEETTMLAATCLPPGEKTERPIAFTQGTNRVVGIDPATIRAEARKILDADGTRGRLPNLWDGAERAASSTCWNGSSMRSSDGQAGRRSPCASCS